MTPIQRASVYLAALFILAGCSARSVVPATSQPHVTSQVSPAVCTTAKIYVADSAKNDVEIYSQGVTSPTPCGKITIGISLPEAVYVDTKGRIYVGNYTASDVTEYVGHTLKLTVPTAGAPFDVFVGSGKILYVAEPTMNKVEEFKAGATTPFLTLSINGGPHGVATDSHNNLYVSYLSDTDGVSHVEKFLPGATTGTDLGFTVGFAGEVKLDAQNDVIIGDRNASIVYIYPPGQTVPSGSFPTGGGKPVNFALNNAQTLFYVSGFFSVAVMDYPSGLQVDSISSHLTSPSGVALFPPPVY